MNAALAAMPDTSSRPPLGFWIFLGLAVADGIWIMAISLGRRKRWAKERIASQGEAALRQDAHAGDAGAGASSLI